MAENGAPVGDAHSNSNFEGNFNNGGAFDNLQKESDSVVDSVDPFLPAAPENEIGFDHLQIKTAKVGSISRNNEDLDLSVENSPGSVSSTNVRSTDHVNRASDLLIAVSVNSETHRARIIEQATLAMEELVKMAVFREPLWQRSGDGNMETLNGIQYLRTFLAMDETMEAILSLVDACSESTSLLGGFDSKPDFAPEGQSTLLGFEPLHIEASRDTGFIDANAAKIVELFMDANLWSTVFTSIVSGASVLGDISAGDGSYNEKIQVMTAEFHLHTPLVSPRQSYFVRYCKKVACGAWAVVDVSLENLFPYPVLKFRRRPSGCLIQELANGSCKVIWVEHIEADNNSVHPIFHPIVHSGYAFSAKRWLAMLARHFQWHATLISTCTPSEASVLISQDGRKSALKLCERMTRTFFEDVNICSEYTWLQLPMNIRGGEDYRVRVGNPLAAPGVHPNATIVFTTSVLLPLPPKLVFDFLRDGSSRKKWDLLSHRRVIRELAHFNYGLKAENRVSILQAHVSKNEIDIIYLQESFWDKTGGYVVYAPLDLLTMTKILNGGDPDHAAILPSGFSILPDSSPSSAQTSTWGTILTIAFHIIDNASWDRIPPDSMLTVHRILSSTAAWIKHALMPFNYQ